MTEATTTRERSRLRTFLLSSALAAGSLLVTLLFAELAVRLIAPQQLIQIRPDIWQPVDSIGWARRPNVSTTINTGERTVDIHTDRDGFRVGANGRTEAERQVLLLGDSFMEALQVQHEQTFAALLEERLHTTLGDVVAVRNAGVGGWGPNNYRIQSRSLLVRDSFDLVVVPLFVGNDAVAQRVERFAPRQPAARARFRLPPRLSWNAFVRAFLMPINDALEVRSHLFVLVRSRLLGVRMRLGLEPGGAEFPEEFLRSEAESPRWALTAEIARDLADDATARDVPVIFILIPTAYQVDSAVFHEYVSGFSIDPATTDLDQPTHLLEIEFKARDLTVLNALEHFRSVHARGTRLYGIVDRHLSPEGHAALTDFVEPAIRRALSNSSAETQLSNH